MSLLSLLSNDSTITASDVVANSIMRWVTFIAIIFMFFVAWPVAIAMIAILAFLPGLVAIPMLYAINIILSATGVTRKLNSISDGLSDDDAAPENESYLDNKIAFNHEMKMKMKMKMLRQEQDEFDLID